MRAGIIGEFGPAQIACIRSWLENGIAPVFLHLSANSLQLTPRDSRVIYRRLDTQRAFDPSSRDELATLIRAHELPFLTAVSYQHLRVLAKLEEAEIISGCRVPIRPVTIDFLEDKELQIELAEQCGMPLLPTWFIDGNAEWQAIDAACFPLVLRPTRPDATRRQFKALHVDCHDQLAAIIEAECGFAFQMVAQPFRIGRNLIVHGSRSLSGEVIGTAAFYADYKYRGVTQRLVVAENPVDLVARCAAFVSRADLIGPYHFEFLIDENNDQPFFLEVNGRLGGTTLKTLKLGYHEPTYSVAAMGLIAPCRFRPEKAGRPVGNRLAAVSRAIEIIRGTVDPIDYPPLRGASGAAKILWGAISWRDELGSFRHWQTWLDYFLLGVGGRLRHSSAGIKQWQRNLVVEKLSVKYRVYKLFDIDLTSMPRAEDELPRNAGTQFEVGLWPSEQGYKCVLRRAGRPVAECGLLCGAEYAKGRAYFELDERDAEVAYLATPESERRRGYATVLLRLLALRARTMGFERLYARVWHSNRESVATFRRAGWRHAETRIDLTWRGSTRTVRLPAGRLGSRSATA